MTKYKHGLVALSADPIHNGHIELIKAAKEQSEKVSVLVANNDEKRNSYLFTLSERQNFAKRAVKDIDGVEVIESHTEVLSDTYILFGCDALFRGIRDDKDQAYEEIQMGYHKLIYPNLNPVYLPFHKNGAISSSVVKAFTKHHIDISQYVPMFVKQALEEKICGQYKIAITGCMAVGKSWVVDNLVKTYNQNISKAWQENVYRRSACDGPIVAKSINFDNLVREVYNDPMPGPVAMKKEIERLFKDQKWSDVVLNDDGTINRSILAQRMFSNDAGANEVRLNVQRLTQPFVESKYRQALKAAGSGLIIIEWAQLAEMGLGYLANNNVIVVDAPDRLYFSEARKILYRDLELRSRFQWSANEKVRSIIDAGTRDGQANVITFSNTVINNKINELAEEVSKLFGI